MHSKTWLAAIVLSLILVSCNLPGGQATETEVPKVESAPNIDAMGTAVEMTALARVTELAGSSAPLTATLAPGLIPTLTLTPTPCSPIVTATTNANVRSGPDTAYDIVGALLLNATAPVSGRNDANTWWYIDLPSVGGGHGWIAASVVTTSCLPSALQVVAAPPLPTAQPTEEIASSGGSDGEDDGSGTPDLVALGMQYYVVSGKKVHVMVSVTNSGDGAAGPFTVTWWANQDIGGCNWNIHGLATGARKDLECEYTYEWGAVEYWSVLFVDSGGVVAESNEGNNTKDFKVKLH